MYRLTGVHLRLEVLKMTAQITDRLKRDAIDNYKIIAVSLTVIQSEKRLSPRYIPEPIKGDQVPNRDITDESATMGLTIPASRGCIKCKTIGERT